MKVAVAGLGNIGRAAAAYLSLRGVDHCAWDGLEHVRRSIEESGGVISISGALGDGSVETGRMCHDISELLDGTDVVLVCVPAFLHGQMAREMAPHLDGQTVLLHPGSTMGAVEFANALAGAGHSDGSAIVMESQSTLFVSRISGDGAVVNIPALKKVLKVAAYPGDRTAEGAARLRAVIKDVPVVEEPSVVKTSFDNPNAMIHPAGILFNLPRLDRGEGFMFYTEGITPSVAALVDAMERERGAVMAEFGVKMTPMAGWIEEVYGVSYNSTHEAVTMNPAYQGIEAPREVSSRYLTEDVPMGLVPMACIGESMGVPTPVIGSLIGLASEVLGEDLRASGRNLAALGLDGMGRDGLISRFGVKDGG